MKDINAAEPYFNEELEQILERDRDPLPKDKIKLIAFVFLYTVLVLLLKGNNQFDSIVGISSCGFMGTLLIFVHLGVSYFCARRMSLDIILKDQRKEELGYIFKNPSDKMSQSKMINCMISGFFAGLIGGSLGLGGAIILIPVWLNLGMDQTRATSTSPPLIFLSALISFTVSLLSGMYHSFISLIFYFFLSYIGSAVVKSNFTIILDVIVYVAQKYQLKSIIFVLLLIIMISSFVALLPF